MFLTLSRRNGRDGGVLASDWSGGRCHEDRGCEDLAEWRAALQRSEHSACELDFIIPGDLAGVQHGTRDPRSGACHFSESQARSWGTRLFTPAVKKEEDPIRAEQKRARLLAEGWQQPWVAKAWGATGSQKHFLVLSSSVATLAGDPQGSLISGATSARRTDGVQGRSTRCERDIRASL